MGNAGWWIAGWLLCGFAALHVDFLFDDGRQFNDIPALVWVGAAFGPIVLIMCTVEALKRSKQTRTWDGPK